MLDHDYTSSCSYKWQFPISLAYVRTPIYSGNSVVVHLCFGLDFQSKVKQLSFKLDFTIMFIISIFLWMLFWEVWTSLSQRSQHHSDHVFSDGKCQIRHCNVSLYIDGIDLASKSFFEKDRWGESNWRLFKLCETVPIQCRPRGLHFAL